MSSAANSPAAAGEPAHTHRPRNASRDGIGPLHRDRPRRPARRAADPAGSLPSSAPPDPSRGHKLRSDSGCSQGDPLHRDIQRHSRRLHGTSDSENRRRDPPLVPRRCRPFRSPRHIESAHSRRRHNCSRRTPPAAHRRMRPGTRCRRHRFGRRSPRRGSAGMRRSHIRLLPRRNQTHTLVDTAARRHMRARSRLQPQPHSLVKGSSPSSQANRIKAHSPGSWLTYSTLGSSGSGQSSGRPIHWPRIHRPSSGQSPSRTQPASPSTHRPRSQTSPASQFSSTRHGAQSGLH